MCINTLCCFLLVVFLLIFVNWENIDLYMPFYPSKNVLYIGYFGSFWTMAGCKCGVAGWDYIVWQVLASLRCIHTYSIGDLEIKSPSADSLLHTIFKISSLLESLIITMSTRSITVLICFLRRWLKIRKLFVKPSFCNCFSWLCGCKSKRWAIWFV